ncbi:MAG: trigger factor [Defluviitaleaceae bacterium]|nr:trigger factor [Defluviitaleaceae bacterium]
MAQSVVERLENHLVKLTLTIEPAGFEAAIHAAYLKMRGRIHLQGFRKGKAPRKLIEMSYGKDIFHEEAINHVLPDAYEAALKEHDLDVVSRPEIDLGSIDENGAVITAEIYVRPQYEIEDYSGIPYVPIDVVVEEAEINEVLEKERERNARMITIDNRPAEMGDTVVIDFKGFVDDVAFEGGEDAGYELTLGTKTFIDTFEEQIQGHNIGDEFDVFVNFPEEYHAEDLAGKQARFRITLHGIKFKELPEADDDFAQEVSIYDTLDELKDEIRDKIHERKRAEADQQEETQILEELTKRIEMSPPQSMYDTEINRMINHFARNTYNRGYDFDEYLENTGMDMNLLRQMHAAGAKINVESRLVLEAVLRKENIVVSDEEFDEEVKRIAESNHRPIEDIRKEISDEDEKVIRRDMGLKKAYDMVKAAATPTAAPIQTNEEENAND